MLNNFLYGGIALLIIGYVVNALTALDDLGELLITLGWVGVVIGLVVLVLDVLRGRGPRL